MADNRSPTITDASAEGLPPHAQLLAGLTLLQDRLTSMPDTDSNSLFATSDSTTTTALLLGVAPGQAVAVGYQGLAHSLSLLMLGDTNAHQAFASTSTAIVTATVNMLLGEANHG